MRFNLLSSFAAGLFIATSICGGVYLSGNGNTTKASVKVSSSNTGTSTQPTESEMKDKLTAAGYIVETKAEYNKKLNDAKSAKQKGSSPAANNQPNKNTTSVIMNVTDGMTSIDVGRMLETAKLVPNAFNFSQDIQNKGLENNLRPGVYQVDSGMSYDQIVSTIFK